MNLWEFHIMDPKSAQLPVPPYPFLLPAMPPEVKIKKKKLKPKQARKHKEKNKRTQNKTAEKPFFPLHFFHLTKTS